jgi:hypothetical protein
MVLTNVRIFLPDKLSNLFVTVSVAGEQYPVICFAVSFIIQGKARRIYLPEGLGGTLQTTLKEIT